MTLRLGVLVSGRGSNLQAILDAITAGQLDARVELVLSNRASAPALERAARAGVKTQVIEHRQFPDRGAFDAALIAALEGAGAEWVVLAGFMRLLTPSFIEAFAGRIVNVHPSLLPAFPGLDAQAQALAYGVKLTGCTVHFVDAGMDTGAIIGQRALTVREDDDVERLSARLLTEEHALLVECLRLIAAGRVKLQEVSALGRATSPQLRPRVEVT